MKEFPTVYGYRKFEKRVKLKARYIHDVEVRSFIEQVIQTSERRRKTLQQGQILCRAQRGFKWRTLHQDDDEIEVEGPYPAERMVPKAEFVGEGRANSRGIPVLYLASNKNTAMSEVRPWVGSYVSMAQFKILRSCEVVDCSMDKKHSSLVFTSEGDLAEPGADGREAGVWGDIAEAFSKPITVDDPHSDYVPTQVLAEAFRDHGYDGIVYKSVLDADGFNIALFDPELAALINCGLYQTKSVSFIFDQF